MLVSPNRREAIRKTVSGWPSVVLPKPERARLALLLMEIPLPGGFEFRVAAKDCPDGLETGGPVALRDAEGLLLAVLHVESAETQGDWVEIRGACEGIEIPPCYGFAHWRVAPQRMRERIIKNGWSHVSAVFLTVAPSEAVIAHLRERMADPRSALLFFAWADPDDSESFPRARVLRELCVGEGERWNLVVIPGPIPGTGWRSAVAKAYGAHDMLLCGTETGYCEEGLRCHPIPTPEGSPIPDHLARIWQVAHPSPSKRGFTVFFTGLSGSGKSTLAQLLRIHILEATQRRVTLLDGDLVRRHLSSELGFSREHRNLNVLRIGWVAGEITRHGGVAICAPIAPYADIRRQVRALVEAHGSFFLVHIATPLEVCESRDRKGLYARARAGEIREFTGVDDPYEPPDDAEIVLDTSNSGPDEAVARIVERLRGHGLIPEEAGS